AKKLNAHIDNFRENVKEVNSLLVNDGSVGVFIDGDYNVDTRGLITIKNINGFHRHDKLDKIIYITNKSATEIE
ncbi:cobalt-precorrin 5A hydrolase, partial [Casaltella massiliensis]|nr:cobalt-precorrin 5A hydrolase [Casaltella massiliensis]